MFIDTPEDIVDYKFKVCLLGDSGVGKSCLLKRLIDKESFLFNDINNNNLVENTIGVDFKNEKLKLEKSNINVMLNFYDTSGAEEYRSIAQSYMQNVQAFVIAYDVTNMKSFLNCQYWLNEINKRNNCCSNCKENSNCDHLIKILVGCKCDQENGKEIRQVVSTKKAKEFAKRKGFCLFFETSSKDTIRVNETFEELSVELISNYIKFLNYQESTMNLVSVPCTSKSFLLGPNSMPVKAIASSSDVYYNCKTEKLNCNHIIFNNKNSKRKNLQTKGLYIFDLF